MNILTIPSSEGSLGKNKGTEKAPQEILTRLHLKGKEIIPSSNLEEVHAHIEKETKNFQGLILGGDHSFSYSSIKTFMKEHPGAQLVIFDAHADCVNDFYPPTHEDYLRTLIENNIVEAENVHLIGTRAVDPIEEIFLKVNPIHHYPIETLEDNTQLNQDLQKIKTPYYLSIDIDVLDPSIAPGTGYPEPNGLTLQQLLSYLRLLPPPTICDLMEINPNKDKENITLNSGIEIIKTIYPKL